MDKKMNDYLDAFDQFLEDYKILQTDLKLMNQVIIKLIDEIKKYDTNFYNKTVKEMKAIFSREDN